MGVQPGATDETAVTPLNPKTAAISSGDGGSLPLREPTSDAENLQPL